MLAYPPHHSSIHQRKHERHSLSPRACAHTESHRFNPSGSCLTSTQDDTGSCSSWRPGGYSIYTFRVDDTGTGLRFYASKDGPICRLQMEKTSFAAKTDFYWITEMLWPIATLSINATYFAFSLSWL